MDLIFPDRIALAQRPTVLQPLPRLSKRYGKKISLWRDDLTGWEFSGNKVRKLEYLCAEAARHGADHLVTCGGPQSNHARATAFAARRLGWDITVVVREPPEGLNHDVPASGNLLLNQLLGANFLYVPYDDYQAGGGVYEPFLEKAARELTISGVKPYIIPEGGSCPTGCWGYLDSHSPQTQGILPQQGSPKLQRTPRLKRSQFLKCNCSTSLLRIVQALNYSGS